MIRYVVPALAVCAFSVPALAADRDVVTISGWSDNILTIGDDDFNNDQINTPANEGDTGIGFSTTASVKVGWTVTSRLRAKINVWFNNTDTSFGTATNQNGLQLRESFFVYDLGGNLSWTMGKYINHVGWIAAEPTGLYKVNASNIGYTGFYGNDVVGTALAYAPKDSPFSGSFHIVNGYFQGADTFNRGTTGNAARENWDLGYGLDLVYAWGKDGQNNVNLEFEYDPHAGNITLGNQRGGSVFQTGLNATFKDVKDLVVGGEVIYRNTTTAKQEVAGVISQVGGSHRQDFGWMLLGNYGIGEGSGMGWFAFPASVTLSIQQLTGNYRAAARGEEDRSEVALALLTNPLDSTNFGLNAEIALASWHNQNNGTLISGTDNAVIFALEGIAVIP